MAVQPPPGFSLHLVLPLLGGMVYVLAALSLKRAADLGAELWRTTRICNFTIAAMFMPLLFLGGRISSWSQGWQPAVAALLFVAGQTFSLLALRSGDVSVATPVLGLKIPMVGLFAAMLLGERISPGLWIAIILSSAAIALLNLGGTHSRHPVGATISLSASAAFSYALFDVLVQKWAPVWGPGRFLPVMMGFVASYSVFLRSPIVPANLEKSPRSPSLVRWVACGAVCLALQGMMIVTSIAIYGQAAVANVLYSSRGLWSVIAVWLIGHWFGNRERHLGPRILAARFAGAALLMLAILIAVFKPSL